MSFKSGIVSILNSLGRVWLIKSVSRPAIAALILVITQTGLIIFLFPALPPQVPLFYSRPWGEAQLGTPFSLFILPAISFIFLTINIFLTATFSDKKNFFSTLLSSVSLVCALFSLLTLVKIISVVI